MSNSTLAGFYTNRIHDSPKSPWNLAKRISSTQRRARILEKRKKKTYLARENCQRIQLWKNQNYHWEIKIK